MFRGAFGTVTRVQVRGISTLGNGLGPRPKTSSTGWNGMMGMVKADQHGRLRGAQGGSSRLFFDDLWQGVKGFAGSRSGGSGSTSIVNRFQNKMLDRNSAKEKELRKDAEEKMVKALHDNKEYTHALLKRHFQELLEQQETLIQKLRGKDKTLNDQQKQLQMFIDVFANMTPEELNSDKTFTDAQVEVLARNANTSKNAVSSILNYSHQMKLFHRYFQRRRDENKPDIKTMFELKVMRSIDRKGLPLTPPLWMRKQREKQEEKMLRPLRKHLPKMKYEIPGPPKKRVNPNEVKKKYMYAMGRK